MGGYGGEELDGRLVEGGSSARGVDGECDGVFWDEDCVGGVLQHIHVSSVHCIFSEVVIWGNSGETYTWHSAGFRVDVDWARESQR